MPRLKGSPRRAIEAINHAGAPVVAVDIASGVNSDTGAVMGAAVRAALTVTFGFAKFGHVSYPGAELCGELEIAEIGFAPAAIGEIAPRGRFFDAAEARPYLRSRPQNSHKGNYGHVMVIAGSRGKSGARDPGLARRAADGCGPGDRRHSRSDRCDRRRGTGGADDRANRRPRRPFRRAARAARARATDRRQGRAGRSARESARATTRAR